VTAPSSGTSRKPDTVRQTLAVASTWLAEQGVEGARVDTELLLAHALGCRRLNLYTDPERPLDEAERGRFRALMRRRAVHEPVAYLIGERGFYGLDLVVDRSVLIPRPETEHLVEAGLEELDRLALDAPRFVDVGAGSGCVALALARARPATRGVALDRSPAALAVAARNRGRLDLRDRVALVLGDLLDALGEATVDLVVSNPPYVTPSEEALLPPDVLDHEPREALFDVAEDLPLTRRLIAQAARVLRPGGAAAVETGAGRAALVAGFMTAAGLEAVRSVRDLAGIERVIVGRRPS